MKANFILLVTLGLIMSFLSFGQSKKELKAQINQLKKDKTQLEQSNTNAEQEKSTLKTKLDRISNINIDDVITPDKQPKDVVIGESGWRTELNGIKYKSDLIGQLGTIWIADSNNQLQPQGAISLTDYKIDPLLINPEKEVIYKTFISKGTQLQGDGGASFMKITASLKNDQYSSFTINIEGTSLIKPKFQDLKKSAEEIKELFSLKKIKGIFICTGMHVVRYHSIAYSKSEGSAKITSPVVNIGGQFYAESSEESSEYYVARQLTQLFKPAPKDTLTSQRDLTLLTNSSIQAAEIEAKKYSPEQLLQFVLKRQPTFDEIVTFQSNPNAFVSKVSNENKVTSKEMIFLNAAKEKVVDLPNQIESLDNQK